MRMKKIEEGPTESCERKGKKAEAGNRGDCWTRGFPEKKTTPHPKPTCFLKSCPKRKERWL